MCGIFAYLSKEKLTEEQKEELIETFEKVKHRGPDNTQYVTLFSGKLFFGFHRLSINDLSSKGDQPLELDHLTLICNGEIYNYKELTHEYGFQLNSSSDCEVILHLYKRFGIEKTLDLISGYFAFALWDASSEKLFVARDPIGVRPLYIHEAKGSLSFCSEMKGLIVRSPLVRQFPPGYYAEIDSQRIKMHRYYDYIYPIITDLTLEEQMFKIRDLFEKAVFKRFMTDRPFGVFLSGGLDSSLVAAIASRYSKERIQTFSIGMENAPDLIKARVVAEHINSIHTEVIVKEKEMLQVIPQVIYTIESYDTTSVRASTPMYILSKFIKEKTDIVVMFSGEGSDEAGGGYLYFHKAPFVEAFQHECISLLKGLCYMDCLRSDKTTAGNGLEVRAPFLDKEFLNEYMKVPPEMKMPKDGMEKWFLRKAFEGYLPDEILWRKKEAFSDGVSCETKSWYQIIQEFVNSIISDEEFEAHKEKFSFNPPYLKESYYYREIFEYYYPGLASTIPYYWLPKWTNTRDPSARTLT